MSAPTPFEKAVLKVLLEKQPFVRAFHRSNLRDGYVLSPKPRIWPCKDGRITVRIEWRDPDDRKAGSYCTIRSVGLKPLMMNHPA